MNFHIDILNIKWNRSYDDLLSQTEDINDKNFYDFWPINWLEWSFRIK